MKTGRVADDQLGDDAVAIREYYQGKGFSDVKIAKPTVTSNGSKVEVVFQITEGSPYKVGKITFRGAQLFGEGELTKVTKLRSGAVYSPAAVQADIKALQDLYGARGYVDFQAGARTSWWRKALSLMLGASTSLETFEPRTRWSAANWLLRQEICSALFGWMQASRS